MSYHHIDILEKQSSKKPNSPCGDVYGIFRNEFSTTIVLSDGLGSGIKANIAANLCISRIFGLIKYGSTLRETFSAMVKTMNKAWGTVEPFAVFSIMQILHNGDVTILTYEMPSPILITKNNATILSDRVYTIEKSIISEVNTKIELGEGIMLISDGISQAGLGNGLTNGWEISGVRQYIKQYLITERKINQELVNYVHNKAIQLWGKKVGDDCSVILAKTRSGIVVNILTGPPQNKEKDKELVEKFNNTDGIKIICGGSTAKIVARELKRKLDVDLESENSFTPPSYSIEGMNIVTEGIVTLNQVYNIMEEEIEVSSTKSKVLQINEFLLMADRINIWSGDANNLNEGGIEFRQQGILHRKKIVELISNKLISLGKLVVNYKF